MLHIPVETHGVLRCSQRASSKTSLKETLVKQNAKASQNSLFFKCQCACRSMSESSCENHLPVAENHNTASWHWSYHFFGQKLSMFFEGVPWFRKGLNRQIPKNSQPKIQTFDIWHSSWTFGTLCPMSWSRSALQPWKSSRTVACTNSWWFPTIQKDRLQNSKRNQILHMTCFIRKENPYIFLPESGYISGLWLQNFNTLVCNVKNGLANGFNVDA